MYKFKSLAKRTVDVGTDGTLAPIYYHRLQEFVHVIPGMNKAVYLGLEMIDKFKSSNETVLVFQETGLSNAMWFRSRGRIK